jgi:hypothetical protein
MILIEISPTLSNPNHILQMIESLFEKNIIKPNFKDNVKSRFDTLIRKFANDLFPIGNSIIQIQAYACVYIYI